MLDWRTRSAEDMLECLRRRLSDFDITRLSFVNGLGDCPIFVSQVFRPTSRSLTSSSGKGSGMIPALVAGIMESIELRQAELVYFQQKKTVEVNRKNFLAQGDISMKYMELMGLNDKYDFNYQMFPGRNLISKELVYLPWETVMMIPSRHDHLLIPSSNGLASGSNSLEASISALLEIIERDSEAISILTKKQRPIDQESIDDTDVLLLLSKVKDLNLVTQLEYIVNNYQLPVVRCILWNRSGVGWEGPFGGCTADNSKKRAILGAITEALQGMVVHIAGARDDIRFNPSKKLVVQENTQSKITYHELPDYGNITNQQQIYDHLISQCQQADVLSIASFTLYEDSDLAVVKCSSPDMSFIHHGHPRVFGMKFREMHQDQTNVAEG